MITIYIVGILSSVYINHILLCIVPREREHKKIFLCLYVSCYIYTAVATFTPETYNLFI